jgi:hypothetical protein
MVAELNRFPDMIRQKDTRIDLAGKMSIGIFGTRWNFCEAAQRRKRSLHEQLSKSAPLPTSLVSKYLQLLWPLFTVQMLDHLMRSADRFSLKELQGPQEQRDPSRTNRMRWGTPHTPGNGPNKKAVNEIKGSF